MFLLQFNLMCCSVDITEILKGKLAKFAQENIFVRVDALNTIEGKNRQYVIGVNYT